MKLEFGDLDEIIKVNELPEISNPVLLTKENRPTHDGLYSYEIFGRPGSKARRTNKAYVDLGRKFLHPAAHKALTGMDKRISSIIDGTKRFKIGPKGFLIADDENGGTGLAWLYENWNKIRFEQTGSKGREFKIDFLDSMDKDVIFIDKWIIISAGYRDIDLNSVQDRKSTDEITPLYQRLIGLTSRMRGSDGGFSLVGNVTEAVVQNLLTEIHVIFTSRLAKKRGMIHQGLLGKGVDYAVRGVISAPMMTSNRYDEQEIPYGYIGLPLTFCLSAFKPLIMTELENFFAPFRHSQVYVSDVNSGVTLLDGTLEDISSTKLEKLLSIYAKSKEDRLATFKFKTAEGDTELDMYERALGRKPTLTDILYIVTERVVRDKHVVGTRYPLIN